MQFKEYRNINQLVNDIKLHKLECSSWFQKDKNIDTIITHSVGANTFRAFKGHPSLIFREWATNVFTHPNFIQSIIALSDESNFDEINLKICKSLKKHWDKYLEPLSIYKARKMVNLLLKEMALLHNLSYEEKQKLIRVLHIPIDSSTLQAIRIIFNNGEFQHNLSYIPQNAKMGYIDSDNKYTVIQEFFKIIAKRADVPPIYFDVLLWNNSIDADNTIIEFNEDMSIKKELNKAGNIKTFDLSMYTMDEYLKSNIFNLYTPIVKSIVSSLLERVSLLKVDFKIKQRKGAFAITPGERTKDNVVTVWTGKKQINIEFYGQEKKPYYNVSEINDILIGKIQKEFSKV